jgi:hypothetical protein
MSETKVYEASTVDECDALVDDSEHVGKRICVGSAIVRDFGAGHRLRITVEKIEPTIYPWEVDESRRRTMARWVQEDRERMGG